MNGLSKKYNAEVTELQKLREQLTPPAIPSPSPGSSPVGAPGATPAASPAASALSGAERKRKTVSGRLLTNVGRGNPRLPPPGH